MTPRDRFAQNYRSDVGHVSRAGSVVAVHTDRRSTDGSSLSLWCNGRCRRFRYGDGRTRIRAATGWEPAATGPKRAGDRGGMSRSWQCGARRNRLTSTCWRARKKGPLKAYRRQRARPTPVPMHSRSITRKKRPLTDSMLGRWVEITGRLESETSKNPDNLRELDVLSSRMVPVVVPPTAAATPPRVKRPRRQRQNRDRPRRRWRRLHLQRHPQSLVSCRRRRASFQRLDWPGCSRLQRPSCFARSVSGNEVDAADTDTDRGHDSSRCCALRRSPLTAPVGVGVPAARSSSTSWRPAQTRCTRWWATPQSSQRRQSHTRRRAPGWRGSGARAR